MVAFVWFNVANSKVASYSAQLSISMAETQEELHGNSSITKDLTAE